MLFSSLCCWVFFLVLFYFPHHIVGLSLSCCYAPLLTLFGSPLDVARFSFALFGFPSHYLVLLHTTTFLLFFKFMSFVPLICFIFVLFFLLLVCGVRLVINSFGDKNKPLYFLQFYIFAYLFCNIIFLLICKCFIILSFCLLCNFLSLFTCKCFASYFTVHKRTIITLHNKTLYLFL